MIPDFLKQPSLDAIVETTPVPDEYYFSKRFKSEDSPEETLRWKVIHGDQGMAPIINRGAQSPKYKGAGVSEILTQGAVISEKASHKEADINRALSKDKQKQKIAEKILLGQEEDLLNRNRLRREWMAANPIFNKGKFHYVDDDGVNFQFDYNIASELQVQLTGNDVWLTGSERTPIADCRKMIKAIKRRSGGVVNIVFINSETMDEKIAADPTIQSLLQKSAFGGPGSEAILSADPTKILTTLFGVPFYSYDNEYPVTLYIQQRTDAATYTVNNAGLVSEGTEVIIQRVDPNQKVQEEVRTIDSINVGTNKIVLDSGTVGTYIAGRDILQARVPFLKKNRLVFMAEKVRNKDVMTWINSPVGLGAVRYGERLESKENWDPDEIFSRVQNMGIWALMHSQVIGTLDIGE